MNSQDRPPAANEDPGGPPGGGARTGLLLGLVVAFGLAWLAAVALPPPAASPGPPDLAGWSDVDAVIRGVVRDPSARRVLVVGDSVVAGTFLEARYGEGSDPLRLVPQMAHAVAPGVDLGLHELSHPGLLPSDLEALVERLAARDPAAGIELLVELSPRYFSRAYADAQAHALPFLAHDDAGDAWPLRLPEAPAPLRALVASRFGLGGLRERLGQALRAWSPDFVALQGGSSSPDMASAIYQLRVRPHFLQLDTSAANPQVAALERTVASLRRQGRRTTFFVTPINEDFLVPRQDAGLVYDATIALGRMIEDDAVVRLVQSNTAAMQAVDFLDHCHPTASGNRVLAAHLLEVLGVPSTLELSPARQILPRSGPRAYVLGAVGSGDQDGLTTQVRFQQPGDLVAVGDGDLIVADTGNHCLKRVRLDRFTAERWVGDPSGPGLRDGIGRQAAFHSPMRLARDGAGGVFVLDAGTDALRHARADGSVVSLPPYDRARGPEDRGLVDLSSWQGQAWVLDAARSAVLAIDATGGPPRRVLELGPMVASSIAVDSDGDLWLLAGPAVPDGLYRVPRAALAAQEPPQLSEFSPLASASSDNVGAQAEGQVLPLASLPMVAPYRLVASALHDELLVLDGSWNRQLSWLLRPDSRVGFLLDPPGEDARQSWPLPGVDIPTFGLGQGDLFWLGSDRSYLVRWDRRVLAADWELGAPGHRLAAAPREGALRLAVLGSSLPGAVGGTSTSSGSTGVATWIQRALGEHALVAGRPVEVHNLCSTGQPLIHSVTAVVAQDPALLHAAVLFVDGASMVRLDLQDRGAAWDDQGLPIPVGTAHPAPWALPVPEDPSVPIDPTGRSHLTHILGALAHHAQQHGIEVVVVDLLPLDEHQGFGVAPDPTGELTRQSQLLVEVCQQVGIALIEPWASVSSRLPARHPIVAYRDDHHYSPRGLELIADDLVERLAPLLQPGFARVAAEGEGGRASVAPGLSPWSMPTPVTADDASALLPRDRISAWTRDGRSGLLLDLTDQDLEPGACWRLAVWAALTHAPRATGALELSCVLFPNRDEYGENAWDSLRFLARFQIAADQRQALLTHGPALLSDPSGQPPAWLERLPDEPGGAD